MHENQFAINSISTSGDSLEQRLDAYAEAGFKQVEFFLPHVKEFTRDCNNPVDARRLLEERGMTCIGGFETHLAVFEAAEARERNHQSIRQNAQLLQVFGGRNLVVGTDGPQRLDGNVLVEIATVFREVATSIQDYHVNLLLEFNWSPVVKSFRSAVEVARKSEMENVGVLFDSAHYHCTPTKFDQIRPDTVCHVKGVHVNDMRDKSGELSNCNSDRELPGEGHLNLHELFGQIEQCGYTGAFCIEMFSDALWALNPREAAQRMYTSMVTLLESPGASR